MPRPITQAGPAVALHLGVREESEVSSSETSANSVLLIQPGMSDRSSARLANGFDRIGDDLVVAAARLNRNWIDALGSVVDHPPIVIGFARHKRSAEPFS